MFHSCSIHSNTPLLICVIQLQPRLVLISKLKPPSDIQAVVQGTGHLRFGENYVQELVEKAAAVSFSQTPIFLSWKGAVDVEEDRTDSGNCLLCSAAA